MKQMLGKVHCYRNGQDEVSFWWDGAARNGYAWSMHEQLRLADYRTLRDTRAALERSDNSDGAHGCASLDL